MIPHGTNSAGGMTYQPFYFSYSPLLCNGHGIAEQDGDKICLSPVMPISVYVHNKSQLHFLPALL